MSTARVNLTIRRTTRTPGLLVDWTNFDPDSEGNSWVNSGNEILAVQNDNGVSVTISFPFGPKAAVDGVTPAAVSVTVAANSQSLFGPFAKKPYNQTGGKIYVNSTWLSAGIKFFVFRLGTK